MAETKTSFEQVLKEHEELRGILAELQRFLELPRPELGAKGSHTWGADLATRLVQLHDKVFRHFREEEESGLLDELQLQHPRANGVITKLKAEHAQILSNFRKLLDSAMSYAEMKEPEIVNLRQETRETIELLQHHERHETELIQQLVSEDLGTCD